MVGRISNPHLILSTAKREKRKLKSKMIVTVTIAIFGVFFVIIGITAFFIEPYRIHYSDHNEDLVFQNGNTGDLRLEFNALNGLMQFRGIDAKAKVIFSEKVNNTSTVEIEFPEGGVIAGEKSGVLKHSKIIKLDYLESDSKSSTYSKEVYLQYDNPGKYDAIIIIRNSDVNFTDTIKSVVTIGSWSEYIALQTNYQTQGLAWLVFGISLITVAPILNTIVDLYYKYFELKRKEFYE